jgi:hypothetical protein
MPKRALMLVAFTLVVGCDERERLTFPTDEPTENEGPVTTITTPAVDSFLTEGDAFVLDGRSVDPDGIDTVYFEVFGTGQAFLPFPGGGDDPVSFGLPIPSVGLRGTTVIVRARAVDLFGNQGLAAVRQISIE